MKKWHIAAAIVGLFILNGCSGYRTATLDTSTQDKITHSGYSVSLLGPPEAGPTELAQAKLTVAIAQQITSGTIGSKKYVGMVENNSSQTILWLHPETPLKMKIKPDNFLVIPLDNMPQDITIFRSDGRYKIFPIENRPKTYAGIKTNFVVSINKVD